MNHAATSIPVLVIAGATGTGKSDLALRLATVLGGSIINADSRQVYADFPLITAQPDAAAMRAVPHSLYGFLPCDATLSAGVYAQYAGPKIAAVHAMGRVPLLVGGTGLYLQTLLSGIAPIPPVDPAIASRWRQACAEEGSRALHALLAQRDPQSAARLHPNDSQRITRALEVLEGTGKNMGYWHAQPVQPSPYRTLLACIDMPLDAITPRLAARVDTMLDAGALEEARAAYARCPNPAAPGWSGIGCAELFAYLTGKMDHAACRAAWVQNTRSYAKRQITWFKREAAALRVSPDADAVLLEAWQEFLASPAR